MVDQPVGEGMEPESGLGHEDPATLFPMGAKTRPMTRFSSK